MFILFLFPAYPSDSHGVLIAAIVFTIVIAGLLLGVCCCIVFIFYHRETG